MVLQDIKVNSVKFVHPLSDIMLINHFAPKWTHLNHGCFTFFLLAQKWTCRKKWKVLSMFFIKINSDFIYFIPHVMTWDSRDQPYQVTLNQMSNIFSVNSRDFMRMVSSKIPAVILIPGVAQNLFSMFQCFI